MISPVEKSLAPSARSSTTSIEKFRHWKQNDLFNNKTQHMINVVLALRNLQEKKALATIRGAPSCCKLS